MDCPFFSKSKFVVVEVVVSLCLLLTAIVFLEVAHLHVLSRKAEQKTQLKESPKPGDGKFLKIYRASCTAYNPLRKQTDSTPRITSIGAQVMENYTIAVSQDFINKKILNYGDTIYIYELQKYYSVEDCMNERYANRLDIFMESKKQARKFGLRIVHFSIVGKE